MVKPTQRIRRQFAEELFECVWLFVGLALKGLTRHHINARNINSIFTLLNETNNFKNVKNTHGKVLLLVKLQVKACNLKRHSSMSVFHDILHKMVPNRAKHLNSANEPSLLALVKASHSTIVFVTAITTIFEENSNMQRGTFLFDSTSTVI